MGGKSMHWADGFIAVDWGTTNRRAYLIDSAGKRPASSRMARASFPSPAGGFPEAIAEIRKQARRQAVAARRNDRIEPRLEGGALRALPGGNRRSRREAGVGGRARGDRSGRVLHRRRARGRRCAARKCSCSARVAAGLVDPMRSSAIPARTTNGRRSTRPDPQLPHRDDGRAVQPAEGSQHPRRPAAGAGRRRSTFPRCGQARGLPRMLPAELFSVRASVLLGQMKKEDAASYASGLLIGTDVRIGLEVPTGAQVVVMGRPELTRLYVAALGQANREAIELDGEQCFLAGIQRNCEEDLTVSARDVLNHYLDECPLVAIVRGVTPGRGRGHRRRASRGRHPDHRSAAQFARPAEEYRVFRAEVWRSRCWSAPAPCSTRAGRAGAGCRRADHRFARDQH